MLSQLQSLLLLLPPELAHQIAFKMGKFLQSKSLYKSFAKDYSLLTEVKPVQIAGMHLLNPIGLAAGFDKNAELVALLSYLGFGFLEIGTVTPLAQVGNPKPRLFRIPSKKSLVNRMGFNNAGIDVVAKNIRRQHSQIQKGIKLGINIGKNKVTPNEEAATDYKKGYDALHALADYIVINVSSPNTPGLRDLQSVNFLTEVKAALGITDKPVFLKLAPELIDEELRDLLQAAEALEFQGIILTNTLSVAQEPSLQKIYSSGGISGELLRIASREALLKAKRHTRLPIISVGGVDSSDEIIWRLQHGASAVQLYTALIYQGHTFVAELVRDLHASQSR